MSGFSDETREAVNQAAAEMAQSIMEANDKWRPRIAAQYRLDDETVSITLANVFIRVAAREAAHAYGLDKVRLGKQINQAILELVNEPNN